MPNKTLHIILSLAFFAVSCGTDKDNSHSKTSVGRVLDFTHQLSFLDTSVNIINTIDIVIVDTPELRNLGLMDVRSLKNNGGMLFIFDQEEPLSFWMANTPLPLDLIFANRNKEIVHIHKGAQPYSQQSIHSILPAIYVVEVNAGYTLQNDLQVGHFINFDL
jgi:uncharacterized membrane protein (UPF0127 family)